MLGVDILRNKNGSLADILMSQNKVVIDGTSIQCFQSGKLRTRKVRLAENFDILPHTEQIVDVFVDRYEEDDLTKKCEVMIEPTQHFREQYALMMASSLSDINTAPTVKVRLMNPFNSTVSIKQDAVIGSAEDISPNSILQTVVLSEDPSASKNLDTIRRIRLLDKSATKPSLILSRETKGTDIHDSHQLTIPLHLQDLFDKSKQGRNKSERLALANLLNDYQDVFSKSESDLGLTHLTEHTIDTQGAKPVKQAHRRTPLAFMGEEKGVIDKLKAQGVIRESCSPWASPILLVRKKDNSVRPVVDYRALNKLCSVDAFPIPKIDDCLDSLSGAKFFSTVDMTSGYFQVPVRQSDIPKTAFITRHGLFEYTSMPQGLTNSSATFQRVMELALKGLQWTVCIIYIDDCIIFSSSFTEHIDRIRLVLERFRLANLKLKPNKCRLLQSEVTFLGYRVSEKGILPDPMNVAKILQWQEPQNVTEIKQFLGLCSYYRKFIRQFSRIAKPLFDLTKKTSSLTWTDDCQKAFNSLKGILSGPDIMSLPQDSGRFILDVDACDVSIGAVLSQMQSGKEKVIAYASRTLNKSECNFCVTDKELLAIRYFVEYFRHYLLGREFTVRSDHQALKFLFSLKSPKGRVARYIEILSEYNFTIQYRKGLSHGNADGLSRLMNPSDCECKDVDMTENLRCGPCAKCLKRAVEMRSSLLNVNQDQYIKESNEKLLNVTNTKPCASKLVRKRGCQENFRHSSNSVLMYIYLLIALFFNKVVCWGKNQLSRFTACVNGVSVMKEVFQARLKISYVHIKASSISMLRFLFRILEIPILYLGRGSIFQCRVTTRSHLDMRESYVPWVQVLQAKDLREKQLNDPNIGPLFAWLESNIRPCSKVLSTSSPETRHYVQSWADLTLRQGVIFRNFDRRDGSNSYLQLLTPREMQKDVLYHMHDGIMSGHLGKKKSRERTLQRYYWYGVRDAVNSWVERCEICGANKPPSSNPKAPLGSMTTGGPLDRIGTDLFGPLPLTKRNNKYILVCTDHFTKWVEIFAIPNQNSETSARVILNEVIGRYGCPLAIHSDQGGTYESQLFAELCELMEIRKTRTSARNPKCNGQTERFNKTLATMIRSYLKDQDEWDLNLGCLAAAYRSTPHESTGLTPNLLMLGREVRLPAEIVYGSDTVKQSEKVSSYGNYVEKLKERLQTAHQIARKRLSQCAKRQKESYDCKLSVNRYNEGDLVWYLQVKRKEAVNPKLVPPYAGPFVVKKKLSSQNYLVQFSADRKEKVVHHDKLKPYRGISEPKWLRGSPLRQAN